MHKFVKIGLPVILVIIAIAGAVSVYSVGWDNIKLRLTRYWGYVTLNNNPLLSSQDADLQTLKQHQQSQSSPRVELSKLVSGGPGKDGIPSIDDPKFVSPQASQFSDNATVIGVAHNGQAKAYPYGILNWHEIVNDNIGGLPITVTLCPLCDTNPVFIRSINGQVTTFGVSGKLFQSCLVMYDRQTDSLWAQPWGLGIAGARNNVTLKRIPAHKTTLGQWRQAHPDTLVMSTNTGYQRDYHRYPYGSYKTNSTLIFPVRHQSQLHQHPKAIISYIVKPGDQTPTNQFGGESAAISHKQLKQTGHQTLQLGNQKVKAVWDQQLKTARFYANGQELPSSTAFAFVYPAFFNKS